MKTIITTSWDDGHPLDVKLAELLRRYDIPATFYIPIKNEERKTLDARQIRKLSDNFDIGGHTLNHSPLTGISVKQAYREIKEGKEKLEEIINESICVFCYPRGEHSRKIVKLVKKAGFDGARTILPLRTSLPRTPYLLGTTVKLVQPSKTQLRRFLKNPSLNVLDLRLLFHLLHRRFPESGWELAIACLNQAIEKGGVFHLWDHSWKIEEEDRWRELERILRLMKKKAEMKHVSLMNNTELVKFLQRKRELD